MVRKFRLRFDRDQVFKYCVRKDWSGAECYLRSKKIALGRKATTVGGEREFPVTMKPSGRAREILGYLLKWINPST